MLTNKRKLRSKLGKLLWHTCNLKTQISQSIAASCWISTPKNLLIMTNIPRRLTQQTTFSAVTGSLPRKGRRKTEKKLQRTRNLQTLKKTRTMNLNQKSHCLLPSWKGNVIVADVLDTNHHNVGTRIDQKRNGQSTKPSRVLLKPMHKKKIKLDKPTKQQQNLQATVRQRLDGQVQWLTQDLPKFLT